MGIFRWIRNNTTRATDHTIGSNYSFLFSPTSAGRAVNERTAMQMTAVYSCVRILAETIAGLPLHVYQTRSDGGKEKAVSHPLYRLLHDEPNPEMTSFVFRETGPLCKLLTVCLCDCCPGRLVSFVFDGGCRPGWCGCGGGCRSLRSRWRPRCRPLNCAPKLRRV